MEITFKGAREWDAPCDALVFCFAKSKEKTVALFHSEALKNERELPIVSGEFTGDLCEISYTFIEGSKVKRAILLGLGKELRLDHIRKAFGSLMHFCHHKKISGCRIFFPEFKKKQDAEVLEAALEGCFFANYEFSRKIKNRKTPALLKKLEFLGGVSKATEIAHSVEKTFEGINLARDLINESADIATPQEIARIAKSFEKRFPKVKTTVLGKKEVEKEKMGLLLAVNRGSFRDPTFSVIEYKGNEKSKERVAVIGKGITFDTGGLNLKPTGSMEEMKSDMSGAAAVLGIIHAAAALKMKVNLVGVIPSTENPIDGRSYKPGDVYESKGRISVEITNTDAEGRLVLADAVSYVVEKIKPKYMVDFATLTGAIEIALGSHRSGLFTNSEKLKKAFKAAGDRTGELVWEMPIDPEYLELLKSDIADIKNSGKRKAGAITGALFIKEFVKDTAWAHLDIAGTAYLEKRIPHATMATGYGVRLFLQALREMYGL